MEFEYLKRKLESAIGKFMSDDVHLLEVDSSERSITHRLAVCLEGEFIGYHVDCEYNRNCDEDTGRKRINVLKSSWEKSTKKPKEAEISEAEFIDKYVYPDIIVHKRNDRKNLLIIEVKKTNNKDEGDYDIEKLKKYTSKSFDALNYEWGAFIKVVVGNSREFPIVQYYRGGESYQGKSENNNE